MQQDTPRQTTGSHDTGAPARDRPEHHPGNWHRDVRPGDLDVSRRRPWRTPLRPMVAAAIALLVGVVGCGSDGDEAADGVVDEAGEVSLGDTTTGEAGTAPARLAGATTGNPRLVGRLDLSVVTELGAVDGSAGRVSALDDRGATWSVETGGGVSLVGDGSTPGAPVGHIAVDPLRMVSDALPDGRPVWWGTTMVVLVQPTERYGHGVLGDAVEAGAFEILELAAEPSPADPHPDVVDRARVVTRAPAVIEGLAALLVDLDGDDRPEIVTTESDDDVGARLVVHDLDGALVARGVPVGRGDRWRNQLGAGPLGPEGEIELVDVETPHIGGDVQWFGLEAGELRRRIWTGSYSTHRIGSRILDQGLIVDVTGDGRPEVLVPTQDQRRLVALSRTASGVSEVAAVDLPARLSSNLAGLTTADGGVVVTVGLEDGTVLRLGTPTSG